MSRAITLVNLIKTGEGGEALLSIKEGSECQLSLFHDNDRHKKAITEKPVYKDHLRIWPHSGLYRQVDYRYYGNPYIEG